MIAVLGAAGRLGGLVAADLATRGAPACALVRRHVDGLPLPSRHADLRDPASVEVALQGASRLLLVTSHGRDQDLLEQAAIGAAYRAGVERIVKISGGAASLGPSGPTTTAVAHWRSERLIEESGLGFTFLRPAFFGQNLLERFAQPVRTLGVLPSPLGSAPIAMVDVRDVAACAVAALLAPQPDHRAWHLTGPAPVAMTEVARHLGVQHVRIPSRIAARAMRRAGASDFDVEHAARMARYFATGADAAPTDHVRQLTGSPARPIAALLDEHAADFAPTTRLAHTLRRRTGA